MLPEQKILKNTVDTFFASLFITKRHLLDAVEFQLGQKFILIFFLPKLSSKTGHIFLENRSY